MAAALAGISGLQIDTLLTGDYVYGKDLSTLAAMNTIDCNDTMDLVDLNEYNLGSLINVYIATAARYVALEL